MNRLTGLTVVACLAVAGSPTSGQAGSSFATFESGQVRPLALSPSGKYLYAVNTPDNRLEVFRVLAKGLDRIGSVQVGLEPVAVAARSDSQVWVVNHLSDSVSIVDTSHEARPRVIRTLLVGDEPRDIIFAGPGGARAFITTAHRGQNVPYDPQFTAEGLGRADVWVFNASSLGSSLGGEPLTILSLFSDTPRALAASADGRTVYAAAFQSGNKTTVVNELLLPDPLRVGPLTNHEGLPQPKVGTIVKYKNGHWLDPAGQNWDFYVQFNLPDQDVFVIDAMASPPKLKTGGDGSYTGVGTVLYNMAVNPVSGRIYVSNTDAKNDERFEGPGIFTGHTVRGNHNENRITVLERTGSVRVKPRHLNKHIDYSECCAPNPNPENARSLAIPTGMVVSRDGKKLYVAALGSSKVGIFKTRDLEDNTFTPDERNHITLSGGGPTGLAIDEGRKLLFALTRFDNGISVIDLERGREIRKVKMFNPEPAKVVAGRPFLYDAARTSSHGDSACATCHVFGDLDHLAWDLGNPDDGPFPNLNPMATGPFGARENPEFAPMKGPLTTQSLRGMSNHGPMHWRGDRTGAGDAPNVQPDSGAYDERAAFMKFNVAFEGLIGRSEMLTEQEMGAFTDFILQVMYPPNPVRRLDNQLTTDELIGRDTFFNRKVVLASKACQDCHRLDPNGNAEFGVEFPGFFGTSGLSLLVPFPQEFKIPHLRNLYTKVGMFGMFTPPGVFLPIPGQDGFLGDQIRGFGVSRSGDFESPLRFISNFAFSRPLAPIPNPEGFEDGAEGLRLREQVVSFLMAFDTNLAPIVGQQVTVSAATRTASAGRSSLLLQRADASECDVVAKAPLFGGEHGFLYVGSDTFMTDTEEFPLVSKSTLEDLSTALPGGAVTYTCVPPGTGLRIGIDRDEDGVFDGDDPDLD